MVWFDTIAAMGPNLNVSLGPLTLKNPVVVASGTFGYGEEFAPFYDLGKLGAITVKGLTLRPRQGNAPHRLAETPCGMLNSIGLQNVGVDVFIQEKLPFLREVDATVIANITGETVEEYAELASRLDGVEGVHAIEINLSCPNVKKGGIHFGTDPEGLRTVVRAVRESTGLPVLAKISPNVTDVVVLARAAKEGGADGLAMINTLLGMAVDLKRRAPVLSNVFGGLSGPAIKPVALRMIWQVHQAVDIPILGMGGIMTAKDALEFMLVGSTAVAVGTANLVKPRAAWDCLRGLQEFFETEGVRSAADFAGTLQLPGPSEDPTLKEITP